MEARAEAPGISRQRMIPWNCGSPAADECTDQAVAMTFSDTVFGFLDPGHGSGESGGGSNDGGYIDLKEEDLEAADEDTSASSIEENKAFWDNQHRVLKEALCKSSSMERAIRKAAKEAMKEAEVKGNLCICRPRPEEEGTCRRCLMSDTSRRLRQAGYEGAVCKSKWRTSPEIPSGEHTFMDVLDNSNPKKGKVRVIIELNFKAEFEMARAGQEYNQLVARLPETFVGKAERLQALVTILCTSLKKCMKDKKMHMGPWRKHKYMLSKWFSTCQTREAMLPFENNDTSRTKELTSKPKASMLTVALIHGIPNMQPKAVAAV